MSVEPKMLLCSCVKRENMLLCPFSSRVSATFHGENKNIQNKRVLFAPDVNVFAEEYFNSSLREARNRLGDGRTRDRFRVLSAR